MGKMSMTFQEAPPQNKMLTRVEIIHYHRWR